MWPSMSTSGRSRPRRFGIHRAFRPSSAITAGTSVMPAMNASAGTPDTTGYGHLPRPPSFVDFSAVDGSTLPELLIDGYLAGRKVASRPPMTGCN